MAFVKISDIGLRGLVVYGVEGQFKYVEEKKWRKYGTPYAPTASTDALQKLQAVIAPLDKTVVFLNLDELPGAPDPSPPAVIGAPGWTPQSGTPWTIVVSETDASGTTLLTQVPSTLATPLDAGAEGDAAVLVRRGAVVAAIPKNSIPSGSFCVLVNLRGIKLPS